MKTSSIVIIAALILAVVGAYFGLSSLSITTTGGLPNEIDIPFSCRVAADCETAILAADAGTIDSLADFKTAYDFECHAEKCVGVRK